MAVVFRSGEGGFPCIRVPSLLHLPGTRTLLAFAECRSFVGDGCQPTAKYPPQSEKVRVPCMKRSEDAGATWGPLSVVSKVHGMYPTTVFSGGAVLLQYATWPHGENYTKPVVQQVRSVDGGISWSAPRPVEGVPPAFPGGCRGASTKGGRALFAGYQALGHDTRPKNYSKYALNIWYSDDGGASYATSPDTLRPGAEPSIAAFNESFVKLVARSNGALGCKCQEATESTSGGRAWSRPLRSATQLASSGCQGSIVYDEAHSPPRLLYAGPDSPSARENLTIWESYDAGGTWGKVGAYEGSASYSCIEATPSAVHVLWETGPDAPSCAGANCLIVLSTRPRDPAAAQRAALVRLFNSTAGEGWTRRDGWGGATDVCEWFGVCCRANASEFACEGDAVPEVTALNLRSNRLVGTLPADAQAWSSLSSLRAVSLRSNSISGTLPPAIGLLTRLAALNLRRNKLGGTLPPRIGQLRQLRHLSFFTNALSGTIPDAFTALQSLGTGAESGLDLRANRMSGSIPSGFSSFTHFGPGDGGGGIGLGGCAPGAPAESQCNRWRCPVPSIRLLNGTSITSYARCE